MPIVNQTILTKTARQTEKMGEKLARKIIKINPINQAICLCLFGNLGSGKTTFAKGFALGLGIKDKITSPTFVILKSFKIIKATNNKKQITNNNYEQFYHIDAYRLKNKKDVDILGLKEILACPKNIVLIEWPEVLKGILPKKRVDLVFNCKNLKARKIDTYFHTPLN